MHPQIRHRMKHILTPALAAIMALAGLTVASAGDGRLYRVTVTNLTRGQVITPPLVVTHDGSVSLFRPGMPASAELAALAEEGATGPLEMALHGEPGVRDVAVGTGPIPPGGSASVEILGGGHGKYLSIAGMLAVTNDAFFAVQGVRLRGARVHVLRAVAYDAGSEGNSESCDHVPGPPCGSMGARNTATAEGFVHVHAGIQGVADLDPSMADWRNPVAMVRIERLSD